MEILRIAALALCAVILIILVKNYKPEFGIFVAIGCGVLILYFMADSLKYAFPICQTFITGWITGKSYFPIITRCWPLLISPSSQPSCAGTQGRVP